MGSVDGRGAYGPKEGDIKLRDTQGRWYLVQGIPVNHGPYTKRSVTIGVIDSGVMVDDPQLKGLIAERKDFTGEGPGDRIGHGTVVAILTLSAWAHLPPTQRAKMPPPRLIIAKVANADGTIDKNAVIYAIQWMAQQGADVVNLSLGFPAGTGDYSGLCDIIARSPKILFLAAAGNFGPSVKVYPAACNEPNMISVAATDPNGDIAKYSGQGDVAANGTAVLIVPSNSRPGEPRPR